MENEIKAKVFAQYLGQLTYYDYRGVGGTERREQLISVELENYIFVWDEVHRFKENRPDCQLILKPLTKMLDEDAKVVSNICFGEGEPYNIEQVKKWINNIIKTSSRVYQYLQSKGYDLPHYLLGGKTLQEAGLAIYQNK